jgi:hypothetical protein
LKFWTALVSFDHCQALPSLVESELVELIRRAVYGEGEVAVLSFSDAWTLVSKSSRTSSAMPSLATILTKYVTLDILDTAQDLTGVAV